MSYPPAARSRKTAYRIRLMPRHSLWLLLCCSMLAGAANPAPQRNLQVLPKDISAGELASLMVRYSRELNVQCQFCHTEGPQGIDFASDESPAKLTARVMIGMLNDINTKYLAQVSDRRYAVPLTCGNCHQGQTTPPVYEAKP
jgi:hypothetical protein